jgi:hypothetical protein
MPVSLDPKGVIRLEGVCPIEEAETLLALRLANPDAPIDWTGCDQAHTAVIQLLFVGRPTLVGSPKGEFLNEMIQPLLSVGGS